MKVCRPTAGRERILVVGNPFLGDTVLAVPVLRNLRRAFPGHAIDVLAEGRIPADVLHACPYIDAVLPWERPAKRPVKGRPMEVRGRAALPALASAVTCGAALRHRAYSRAYMLKRSPSAAVLACCAGIPRRIGHAASLVRPFLTHAVPDRPGAHRIDAWLDLLRAEGLAVDDGRLESWSDPAALARADRLLERLPAGRPRVFLAVTASNWRRQWPLERWCEVVRLVVTELGGEVVLCGHPDDGGAHVPLVAAAPGHVHDFSAIVPLREAGALVSRMDLFVGIESGLMHLAAAHGVPTVTLFDPRTVTAWRPRGIRDAALCGTVAVSGGLVRRRERPPRDTLRPAGAVLGSVTVEQVVGQIAAFLPRGGRPAPRTLDLRTGRHRYEVVMRPAAGAAAVPAAG